MSIEDTFQEIISQNKDKITVALIMEFAEEISDTMISIMYKKFNFDYKKSEETMKEVLKELEQKYIKNINKNAN